jgi:hypothetical protein
MNVLRDVLEGVASGFVSALFESTPDSSAGDLVETCCQQLGWSIDERPSAHEMCLHFTDPLIRTRKVLVGFGDRGIYVGFTVFSAARIPPQQVPLEALGYLLERNGKAFVGWQMCIADDGNVGFAVNYFALAAGLRPEIFKLLCETMIEEAHEFDAKMDKAGLLG